MAVKQLYTNVVIGGTVYPVISVEVTEGHKQAATRCSITLEDITGIGLNNIVSVDMGYTTSHGQLFYGYIDTIKETRMPGTYTIECRDVLKRAMEHFIVSTDLKNPWSRTSISAEDLVGDLLAEAGITNYIGETTAFTFGTTSPAEFNLISSWDAIQQICHILAYNCYTENNVVYFKRVAPVPAASASTNLTVGNSGTIITTQYQYSTENLRNKVVVFGRPPI